MTPNFVDPQDLQHYRATVIQFNGRSLLFKKCGQPGCNGSGLIQQVIVDRHGGGHDRFFCQACDKVISKVRLNFSLRLQVIDIERGETLSIVAYDEVAEVFMGCKAEEYYELAKQDKNISDKLESLAMGAYVDFTTRKSNIKKKGKSKEKGKDEAKLMKIEKIVLSKAKVKRVTDKDDKEAEKNEEGIIGLYKAWSQPDTSFKLDPNIIDL